MSNQSNKTRLQGSGQNLRKELYKQYKTITKICLYQNRLSYMKNENATELSSTHIKHNTI